MLYPCNHDVELQISHNFPGQQWNSTSNRALFFTLQRPWHASQARAGSLHFGRLQGKNIFIWLLTGFGKSVCYEMTPFLAIASIYPTVLFKAVTLLVKLLYTTYMCICTFALTTP